MKFIASINTRIYGISYLQGETVQTDLWTRKQQLQFLGLGLISGQQFTSADLSSVIELIGAGGAPAPVAVDPVTDKTTITIPVENLDWLSDVDLATTPPSNGQTLVYNSVLGLWKPGTIAGGGGGGGGISYSEVNATRTLPVTAKLNGTADTSSLPVLIDGVKGTSYTMVLSSGSMDYVIDMTMLLTIPRIRGWWYPDSRQYLNTGIDVSIDNATWVTVLARANRSCGSAPYYIEGIPSQLTKYRYVRFHSEGSNSYPGNECVEFEVFGLQQSLSWA